MTEIPRAAPPSFPTPRRTAPCAPRGRCGRPGFTLVEILLALAIFSGLIVLLLAAFGGAERTREALAARTRGFRELRLALDRIGGDLQGAFAADGVEATALSCRTDTFSGKPAATLTFTAFALADNTSTRPGADIVKVRYAARPDADGTTLELYREQSDLPLIENRMAARETRIAGRLAGFRLEAWDGAAWVKEWPQAGGKNTTLPRKIAFVLSDEGGIEYRRVVSLPLAGSEATILSSGKRSPEQR